MKAILGTLLSCDAAAKQLIVSLDERGGHFIIQDLDETHLLVDSTKVEDLRALLEEELEKNSWSVES
ncbi:unnamed protein product [Jaminaea pallidilutea]